MSFAEELAAFRAAHPDVLTAEIFMVDLNARIRGKIVPINQLDKIANGAMKMPTSTPGLDFFSSDTEGGGLAIETGDPDGVLDPVPGSLRPILWARQPTAQVQVTIRMPDGQPADFDARNILARQVDRAAAMGLTPVMAMEQEFFLIDPTDPVPAPNPASGERLEDGQVYDLDIARALEPVLTGITEAAMALGMTPTATVTEYAGSQFEINLAHVPDALRAADQGMWLRRAVRSVARAHGLDATFMAKPFGATLGSGLHLHVSLKDRDGRNIFDGADGPNPALRHAVAGMVAAMPETMLIFAPHLNAYRRLVPESLVPVEASWSIDNRGAAVRLPEVTGPGARFEHRVAAADANPYLVAAAVLAAALDGIEAGTEPPPPLSGEIRPGMAAPLPLTWDGAIERLAVSDFVARHMGTTFRHVYALMKAQERDVLRARVTDVEHALYLRRS